MLSKQKKKLQVSSNNKKKIFSLKHKLGLFNQFSDEVINTIIEI